MNVREFSISTRHTGRRRTVRVKVYDDLEQLRSDGDTYVVRRIPGPDRQKTGRFSDALGITHSWNGTVLMRLWAQRLGTSVIAHEVVHAASGIYRQDWEAEHGPVYASMDNEETLAYLVGDLTARIVDRLYFYGFYG